MKYSTPQEEKAARAYGKNLPVSFKKSVEISNYIRGNTIKSARQKLQLTIDMKKAIPYRRFANGGVGHKKNIGPGRYPINTCIEFLKLIRSAEANAQQRGLDVAKLFISTIVTKKAEGSFHYGRKRRRKMKIAHIEIVLKEKELKQKTPKKKEDKK